jgi:hypothetical protein
MRTLLDSIRGTLATVVVAADHVAWYVEWQTGGRRCARSLDAGIEELAGAVAEAA